MAEVANWPSWLRFRPIQMWPYEQTKNRQPSAFRAPWAQTVNLLTRELVELQAKNVVLQVALREDQIRVDGMPRANVRAEHPGVILSFDSKYGALSYATDKYPTWQENIRGIAKSLEWLRGVDRYGVSKGQQYTGWKQLGAGPTMSQVEAAEFVVNLAGVDEVNARTILVDDAVLTTVLRLAAKRAHPDTGGNPKLWERYARAKQVLGG